MAKSDEVLRMAVVLCGGVLKKREETQTMSPDDGSRAKDATSHVEMPKSTGNIRRKVPLPPLEKNIALKTPGYCSPGSLLHLLLPSTAPLKDHAF